MSENSNRIVEGEAYQFIIEKTVTLPGGDRRFILKGPYGRKYFLPAVDLYNSYNLMSGRSVKCRVDKINCKGEVFLEPEHPLYREDAVYSFPVVRVESFPGKRINRGVVIFVESLTGDEVAVPLPSGIPVPVSGDEVELIVRRIRKGKLHLSFGLNDSLTEHLEKNRTYQFRVVGTETDYNGEELYVVEDSLGVSHAVMKKYYDYYGLKTGGTFTGSVVKYRDDGTLLIEPDNPLYNTGQYLELTIVRNEKNTIDNSYYIVAKDRFDRYHELRTEKYINSDSLLCRIVKIRKGKLLLEPVIEE